MGNRETISRGHIQHMSAGIEAWHSEHNMGKTVCRFLQMWIYPGQKDGNPITETTGLPGKTGGTGGFAWCQGWETKHRSTSIRMLPCNLWSLTPAGK